MLWHTFRSPCKPFGFSAAAAVLWFVDSHCGTHDKLGKPLQTCLPYCTMASESPTIKGAARPGREGALFPSTEAPVTGDHVMFTWHVALSHDLEWHRIVHPPAMVNIYVTREPSHW